MTYRPCPTCGAAGEVFSANAKTRIAIFLCSNNHFYSTVTATNGMLLEVRS